MRFALITQSLKRGFADTRKERIKEWSSERTAGFFKPWFRRGIAYPVFSTLAWAIKSFVEKSPLGDAIVAGFIVGLGLMFFIGVADGFYWVTREREWRKSLSR
jgi:hypothetical protein